MGQRCDAYGSQKRGKRDHRGPQELMEFRRGEIEVRGLNSGATKRSEYLDICEIKRKIEGNEIDLGPRVMRLG